MFICISVVRFCNLETFKMRRHTTQRYVSSLSWIAVGISSRSGQEKPINKKHTPIKWPETDPILLEVCMRERGSLSVFMSCVAPTHPRYRATRTLASPLELNNQKASLLNRARRTFSVPTKCLSLISSHHIHQPMNIFGVNGNTDCNSDLYTWP